MKNLILTFCVFVTLTNVYSQGTVEYKVSSTTAGFSVTYTNSGGNTEQKKIASKDWSTTFEGTPGSFVSISAQAEKGNSKISVKILYQGKVIEEANSSGDYVIASASGSLHYHKSRLIVNPYSQTFSGTMTVYTYSPILAEPDMVNSKTIAQADKEVTIIERVNEKYYKVKAGENVGYIWAGWFTKE